MDTFISLWRWALKPLGSSNYKIEVAIVFVYRRYSEYNLTEL